MLNSGEEPLSDSELEPYQYCATDKDCVAVHNGCCPICPTKNGEKTVWIHRDQKEKFEALFNKNCVCAQCVRVDEKRFWKPTCVEKKCAASRQ
jgi:hypothetical protein